MKRPTSLRREDGVSVIFTLVFLVVVFTLITAVLAYARSTALTVTTYQRDRALRYAADAALETAVQMVKEKPDLGVSAHPATPTTPEIVPPACGMVLLLAEHDPGGIFAPNARLDVTCAFTPGQVSGGFDADGGQALRDVTFTVECRLPSSSSITDLPLQCGSANPKIVHLAEARVRFDLDYGYVDPLTRARVPQIVTWEIDR